MDSNHLLVRLKDSDQYRVPAQRFYPPTDSTSTEISPSLQPIQQGRDGQ